MDFKGKIVMDVGSGSGLIAMLAASVGAKKVYSYLLVMPLKQAIVLNGLKN